MDGFAYVRADSIDAAIDAARGADVRYIGGGTNLLDLMKGGVEHAGTLVDITRLDDLARIETTDGGGLHIGALVRNSDLASHGEVRTRYPLRSAGIAVEELAGKPGTFICTVRLQPHFQLDDVSTSFHLIAEMAPPTSGADTASPPRRMTA